MSRKFTIRPAIQADCEALGVIGPEAYAAAYGDFWDDKSALSEHLSTYGPDAFRRLIDDASVFVWLAENHDGPVGFLSMHMNSPDPITKAANTAEVRRIYLLPDATGRGVGRALLEAAQHAAKNAGMTHIWLDAMRKADWSHGAYKRWGFEEIGADQFPKPLKPGYGEMIVMRITIN